MTDTTLSQKVATFKHDVDIAHQITHGDETTVVLTENGPVRSLAKLIHDAEAQIHQSFSSLTTTHPLLIKDGMFTLPTQSAGDIVWNMAMVFLDLEENDFLPDGSLKNDRDYLIEDHIGLVVANDGVTVNISGDTTSIEGKHACVTYMVLTIKALTGA